MSDDVDTGAAALRVPPHSEVAEQSVLGALLMDPTAFGRVTDVVGLEDFYSHSHRVIFGAIAQIVSNGHAVDTVAVYEQLEGETWDYGGLAYLNQLQACVPSAVNARRHAEIIAEHAARRRVIAAADDMTTKAFRGEPPALVLDEARIEIARIRDRCSDGPTRRRLPVLAGPDLIASAASMRWLVKGIVPAESIGMIFGASGTFKSFVALDLACHIAHGLPWLGRRTQQGKVLWIAAEGGRGIGYRLAAWHRSRNLPVSTNIVGIPASIDLGTDAWRVVDAVQTSAGFTPSIVVTDTLSQTYTAGADENSASDMAAYIRELGTRFRDLWKCTVALIHHTGHNATDRPRGSSVIQPNTDFLLGCYREEKQMMATLTCEHQKDGDRFDDARFSLTKVDLGKDEQGDRVSSLVARHLSNPDDVSDALHAEVAAGRATAAQRLQALVQNGMRESDLRRAFDETVPSSTKDEARRKAYARARAECMANGVFEVSKGIVITLRSGIKGGT